MAKKLGATKLTDNVLVTSASLTSEVTGVLPVSNGGTGTGTYTNGQLLIGNTTGNTLTKATLTAGSNISITNGAGSITIAATAGAADAGTLTGTTLASNVVSSSLTSVGTLGSLSVSGDVTIDTSTLKVDSTNNRVGIGMTNPAQTLDVTGTAKVSSDVFIGDATGWANSRLQVGNSAVEPAAEFNGTGNTANQSPVYVWNNVESGSTYFISFYSDGQLNARTLRGYINYRRDNGTLNLTAASDYRIKTIHGPYKKSGEVFDQIQIHEGNFTGESGAYPMVVAHELADAVPYAVEGEKDAVNEDGTPKLQMVSYTAMIPLMLAEIKSLRARIAALEAPST